MVMDTSYRIRPAGRHILTIGRYLIQDDHAAIVELVKNAYDADSPTVKIVFTAEPNKDEFSIVISDQGHGMSREDVIDRWMVPSTEDKMKRKKSPSGRIMQGSKGIGRYATSILGEDLFLETIKNNKKTTIFIEWKKFEENQYLDNVEILIETVETSKPSGTKITIRRGCVKDWYQKKFDDLQFELKKLVSPMSHDIEMRDENINIHLSVSGFPEVADCNEVIEPYPLLDLFDYRISGEVQADGNITMTYCTQKARNTKPEEIYLDANQPTGCGKLKFDIRVYDRDKDSIDLLINRGLKDESGNYLGKLQTRQLLNRYNGIGVYRNGFRIRPLGDAGFDWLRLDAQRVQNPSQCIGSSQVIGHVQIESEEISGLTEKSARDGLKENNAFIRLREITQKIICTLEERRFIYRKKAGISRQILKIEQELERPFLYEDLKHNIKKTLKKFKITGEESEAILEIISKDEQKKMKLADEIKQNFAVYQGQATLGKIIGVILHEGRQPLSYLRNQIPNLMHWHELFLKGESGALEKIKSTTEEIAEVVDHFVKLFRRIDPLAISKRSAKQELILKEEIQKTLSIFEKEMKEHNITSEITGSNDFKFSSWPQDIHAIFLNFIDNSLYWMHEKKNVEMKISITLKTEGNDLVYIDYRDTGPGIEPDLIESEVIFEPSFSTKPNGTGLGLAIAGETATRNGLELKALESDQGVYFRIQPKVESEK